MKKKVSEEQRALFDEVMLVVEKHLDAVPQTWDDVDEDENEGAVPMREYNALRNLRKALVEEVLGEPEPYYNWPGHEPLHKEHDKLVHPNGEECPDGCDEGPKRNAQTGLPYVPPQLSEPGLVKKEVFIRAQDWRLMESEGENG